MFKVNTLDKVMAELNNGVYDMTKNGECIQCGECCSNLLPMSMDEIKRIKKYIKRNRIKEQNIIPFASGYSLLCPFLNISKSKEKCEIYPVRPFICREFKCDNASKGIRLQHDGIDRFPIDMRETFFSK